MKGLGVIVLWLTWRSTRAQFDLSSLQNPGGGDLGAIEDLAVRFLLGGKNPDNHVCENEGSVFLQYTITTPSFLQSMYSSIVNFDYITFQVWRPVDPSTNTYKLIWQYRTLPPSNTVGIQKFTLEDSSDPCIRLQTNDRMAVLVPKDSNADYSVGSFYKPGGNLLASRVPDSGSYSIGQSANFTAILYECKYIMEPLIIDALSELVSPSNCPQANTDQKVITVPTNRPPQDPPVVITEGPTDPVLTKDWQTTVSDETSAPLVEERDTPSTVPPNDNNKDFPETVSEPGGWPKNLLTAVIAGPIAAVVGVLVIAICSLMIYKGLKNKRDAATPPTGGYADGQSTNISPYYLPGHHYEDIPSNHYSSIPDPGTSSTSTSSGHYQSTSSSGLPATPSEYSEATPSEFYATIPSEHYASTSSHHSSVTPSELYLRVPSAHYGSSVPDVALDTIGLAYSEMAV